MKMKEFGPPGGGRRAALAPALDSPMARGVRPLDFHGCVLFILNVSGKPQYKDAYRRTIEILQSAHIFEGNYRLKVHNAHLKLASSISG